MVYKFNLLYLVGGYQLLFPYYPAPMWFIIIFPNRLIGKTEPCWINQLTLGPCSTLNLAWKSFDLIQVHQQIPKNLKMYSTPKYPKVDRTVSNLEI